MQKKKGYQKEFVKEEVGKDFNPDDLDIREDNDLTEEQYNNTKLASDIINSKHQNKQNLK